MDTKVNIQVYIDESWKYEYEIEVDWEQYLSIFRSKGERGYFSIPTRLRIKSPKQPTFIIEDAFFKVMSDCFRISGDLARNRTFFFYDDYYHEPYCSLESIGETIRISEDIEPTINVPRAEFLPALYYCGKRMARWYSLVMESQPNYQNYELLKKSIVITRKRLEHEGYELSEATNDFTINKLFDYDLTLDPPNDVVERLIHCLDKFDDYDLQIEIIKRLEIIDNPQVVPALLRIVQSKPDPYLADKDVSLFETAIIALFNIDQETSTKVAIDEILLHLLNYTFFKTKWSQYIRYMETQLSEDFLIYAMKQAYQLKLELGKNDKALSETYSQAIIGIANILRNRGGSREGKKRDPQVIELLKQLLNDPNLGVRLTRREVLKMLQE